MKDVIFNVRNCYTVLDKLQEFEPWALFDKLGGMIGEYSGVTSPQMLNQTHAKQHRDTYELYKYRKAGHVPTFTASPRRGYTAITFIF